MATATQMKGTMESGSGEPVDAKAQQLTASEPLTAASPTAPAIEPWKGIGVWELLWSILAGLWFGFALQKAGVGDARVIQQQFTFADNTMLVMFLTASATSALTIGSMKAASSSSSDAVQKAGKKYLSSETQGFVAVGVGGLLVGAGMSVAGTCPGTIWAQLGAGQPKTLITFAGAIVGAAIIAVGHRFVDPVMRMCAPKSRTVAAVLGMAPMAAAAIIAGAFMAVVVAVLLIPGAYSPLPGAEDVFGLKHWHPVVGGIMVGLVQVPLTLGVRKNLGASTSFSVIAGNLLRAVGLVNDYTRPLVGGTAWWNVLFVAAATAGASLAAWSGNTWYAADAMPVTEAEAFVGGVLLLLGARLASGCTSGHGITGVGHGSLISIVGVAGIFAGGIAVAFGAYGGKR